jgi:hypothetical protein
MKTFSVLKMGEDGLKPMSKTKLPCLGIKEKPWPNPNQHPKRSEHD